MADFPEKAEDNVNVLTTVIIGGVSTIVLWAGVIALQAYYDATGGEMEAERFVANQSRELRQARAEHLADLADYRYIDSKTGTVKMPIERAMALVSEDARKGAATLVPAVGSHDTPTLPIPGQTLDPAVTPDMPADPAAVPADGEAPVEGADEAAPEGAGTEAAPADKPAEAAAAPAESATAPAKPAAATARADEAAAAPAEEGSAN